MCGNSAARVLVFVATAKVSGWHPACTHLRGTTQLSDAAAQAEIAIVRYLLAHPDARDTVEGIEKWWLPASEDFGAEAVAAALERLMDRSLVIVWKSATAKPVYGLASTDSRALREYLRTLQQSPESTRSGDKNIPS